MPLPLIPSSPRRRLYEPEATRGGEMGPFTRSSYLKLETWYSLLGIVCVYPVSSFKFPVSSFKFPVSDIK